MPGANGESNMSTPATTTTTLAALKAGPASIPAETVRAGFDTAAGFTLMQRGAQLLANSTIVPAHYRAKNVKKDRCGNVIKVEENPSAMSNCVVALNMATRMGADPLMIMQNLYIVEGRPAWSSQYIIASINACGKYSPLRFKLEDLGHKEAEYTETTWVNNKPVKNVKKVDIHDMKCIAWAIEKKTGEVLESPPVTIELAVKEGWYGKNGSKWQTMPEVMLRYRAASFFGKLYAPELLMGIQTAEEVHDGTYDLEPAPGGGYQVTVDDLRRDESATQKDRAKSASAPDREAEKQLTADTPKEPRAPRKTPTPKPEEPSSQKQAEKPQAAFPPEDEDGPDSDFIPPESNMTVPCPNRNGAQVDELNCASCPSRARCPTWE